MARNGCVHGPRRQRHLEDGDHSRRMRRLTAVVFATLALSGACLAAKQDLAKVMPADMVKDWKPVNGSEVYASRGQELTVIYDGGYQEYTNAGVTEALRRVYQNGKHYIEVTSHLMKTPRAARAFVADRYKRDKHASLPAKASRYTIATDGAVTGYAASGRLLFITVTPDDSSVSRKATEQFLSAMQARSPK